MIRLHHSTSPLISKLSTRSIDQLTTAHAQLQGGLRAVRRYGMQISNESSQGYEGYLILLAVTLIAMVLGLFIAFQAYRGYRRNRSRRMLFLALGLLFLTVVPFLLSLVVTFLAQQLGVSMSLYTISIATRIVEIIGLACLLYSLSIR